MRSITVGFWIYDTLSKQHESTTARLEKLEDSIFKFDRFNESKKLHRDKDPLEKKRKFDSIFLAPENLFCKPLTEERPFKYGDTRQVEEIQKEQIVRELRKLSRAYPKILMVPGSISWRKKIDKPEPEWWRGNRFALLREPEISRREKSRKILIDSRKRLKLKHEEEISREYGALEGAPHALTTKKKIEYLEEAEYIAKNTAYVLLNGMPLLKYNKATDYHEVLNGPKIVFIPGIQVARFTCDDMMFSLDICLDNDFALQGRGPAVDIHLLISAATEGNIDNTNIKNGGWFLHCSSESMYYTMEQKGFGKKTGEEIERTGDVRCSEIALFEKGDKGTLKTLMQLYLLYKMQQAAQQQVDEY